MMTVRTVSPVWSCSTIFTLRRDSSYTYLKGKIDFNAHLWRLASISFSPGSWKFITAMSHMKWFRCKTTSESLPPSLSRGCSALPVQSTTLAMKCKPLIKWTHFYGCISSLLSSTNQNEFSLIKLTENPVKRLSMKLEPLNPIELYTGRLQIMWAIT